MNIAILEDKLTDRLRLIDLLTEYCDANGLEMKLAVYDNGQELLTGFSKFSPEIVFLDILMDGISGIQTAQAIRELDEFCILMFTTVSRSYSLDGFQVGAAHYLIKPLDEPAIEDAMKRAIHLLKSAEKRIHTFFRRQMTTTYYNDIYYIEVLDKVCYLYTRETSVKTYCTLDELEARLGDPRFLRCHRSYLVNMDKVRGVNSKYFLLDNNQQVPISRIGKNQIKESYNDYLVAKLCER